MSLLDFLEPGDLEAIEREAQESVRQSTRHLRQPSGQELAPHNFLGAVIEQFATELDRAREHAGEGPDHYAAGRRDVLRELIAMARRFIAAGGGVIRDPAVRKKLARAEWEKMPVLAGEGREAAR
jgi:hypothetical protein